ncbi:hypothetical protein SDC9_209529 [bioreactor metagenome]|uniref:Uncharacterized protein n=1 Tax=bioreactor metagenome TaxID=1076179 RepID=A0A645JEA5_9ZZZZ
MARRPYDIFLRESSYQWAQLVEKPCFSTKREKVLGSAEPRRVRLSGSEFPKVLKQDIFCRPGQQVSPRPAKNLSHGERTKEFLTAWKRGRLNIGRAFPATGYPDSGQSRSHHNSAQKGDIHQSHRTVTFFFHYA